MWSDDVIQSGARDFAAIRRQALFGILCLTAAVPHFLKPAQLLSVSFDPQDILQLCFGYLPIVITKALWSGFFRYCA